MPKKSKSETPEEKAFHAALRRTDRALLALRTSAVDHTERYAVGDKIRKAIDRQTTAARRGGITDPAALARLEAQWSQVPGAMDQAAANYRAENERQIAELDSRIRERNASQGGYEKELELARGKGRH